MRLYQVKKLEGCRGGGHQWLQSLALLRVADVDKFADLADPYSLLGDSRFQFLGGTTEHVMPARLQSAPNVRLLRDRRDVDSDSISQGVADGLTAENPAHSVNFEFGVTEFARGLKIGQHGGARRVDDCEKASLSALHRRGRSRQGRHQDLNPAFAEIGLRLRRVTIAHEVHLQTVSLQKRSKDIARQGRSGRPGIFARIRS